MTALRRASVGCAVRTGCISRSASSSVPRSWPISSSAARHGLALWLAAGVAVAERTDPLVLLGEVDQMEVDGERASDQLGAVQRPAADDLRGVGLLVFVAAGRDDRVPQRLDVVQETLPAVLDQDLAEQASRAGGRRRAAARASPAVRSYGWTRLSA